MAGLFLVDQTGKLTALTQEPYDTEDLLQGLLADYPDLLGGDQMGGSARRWLFVAREAPIPDQEGGSGRWSLDHLFLDQDSIPTFVEVKRASDTRIRREVVGQMLDYAANGLLYWPLESIQGFLAQDGVSADDRLAEAFGPDVDTGAYWQRLKENIAEGRVRLLFVADRIPAELLAVIEFLNSHMSNVDVLAVEVPQFVGEGLRTLAPRVLGQTQAAIRQKQVGGKSSRKWDEKSFFGAAADALPEEQLAFVRRYYDWAVGLGWPIVFGRGGIYGSFYPRFKVAGENYNWPIVCYTEYMEFGFRWASQPPFDDPVMHREFVIRMNRIPGANFSDETSRPGNKYPTRSFEILAQEGGFEALVDAMTWYMDEAERVANQGAT